MAGGRHVASCVLEEGIEQKSSVRIPAEFQNAPNARLQRLASLALRDPVNRHVRPRIKVTAKSPADPRCSFCRKAQFDAGTLVADPTVYICDECIEICNEILAEDKAQADGKLVESVHFGRSRTDGLVRCRLCQVLFQNEECPAFPGRGWLCFGCVDLVRQAPTLLGYVACVSWASG
jgi:hypothetical protein